MKEMSNSESSTKTGWSLIRKVQIIGALIGFLVPITMMVISMNYKSSGGEGNQFGFFLAVIWGSTLYTAGVICDFFGYNLQIDMTAGRESTWIIPTLIAALINAILLCLVVGFLGWLMAKYKKQH